MNSIRDDYWRIIACVWLVIATITGLLTLVPWFVVVLLVPMMFDSGWQKQSTSDVLVLIGFPLLPFLASAAAWLLLRTGRYCLASIVAAANYIPVAWIAIESA